MRKKIILIVSNGKSGSTVLDKALGSHSRAFSVGALSHLDVSVKEDSLCSCTHSLSTCPFWLDILDTFKNTYNKELPETLMNPIKGKGKGKGKGKKNAFVFLGNINLKKLTEHDKRILEDTKLVYDLVYEKQKPEVIIDSSKNLRRALMLRKYLKDYEVLLLHLVRDGRAVLNSYQKKTYHVASTDKTNNEITKSEFKRKIFPPIQIIQGWKNFNLRTLLMLKFVQRKSFVRYEDFANNPVSELTRIFADFGITYHGPPDLDLTKVDYHMVGGNASRLNAKKISAPEAKWKKGLNTDMIKMFEKKAGWLNKYFGYV